MPVCGRGIAVTMLTLPRLLGLHSPREHTGSGWLRACAGTLPLVLGIANNATGYQQQSREEPVKRQCPGPREPPGLGDQDSMSQRLPASRPASRSPSDVQKIAPPPVQVRDEYQPGGHQVEAQQPEQVEGRGHSHTLPSPQSVRTQASTPGEDWRSGPLRDLGVHSILNPTVPQSTPSSSRRVSIGTTESPLSVAGPASQLGASPTVGTPLPFPGHEAPAGTPPTQEGPRATSPHGRGTPAPRRILTPRSLAARLGRGGQPPGTIDAQRSPFLPPRSRTYTAEPGQSAISDIPPMPSPQERSQPYYGFPGPAQTPDRRTISMPITQMPGQPQLSQSASPIGAAPSVNPSSSQVSHGSFPYPGGTQPPTSTPYYPGSTFAPQTVHQGGGALQYQAPASGTQGASARFRQRRKEKEKEANTTIEKMQHQTRELERRIREVEQERDFYRGERDRMRDVLARTPEMRHLAVQGPPSPQTLRTGSYRDPAPPSQPPAPPAPTTFPPQEQPTVSERAPRRRRTGPSGEFTSIAYSLPPASTLPPVQAGYPGQGTMVLPPLRMETTAAPTLTGTNVPPVTTTGPPPPFDPFSRGGYQQRGWPSDGGQR
ncbi:hypothetical protein OIDMADRAFT_101040 [Oidiodendron maius Zn]|uniref:BZIP domain-containing protein n=1 Tax=Oidiodendron maius (strain Zn) TaxID=913774 RepID=A0A0C3HVL7_OIDMZ|nr:hypothetical protein OIDMADRAFT_101040 [Oidiodendron maius Zn]